MHDAWPVTWIGRCFGPRSPEDDTAYWQVEKKFNCGPLANVLKARASQLQQQPQHSKIRLMLISGFYYVAKATGIVTDDEAYSYKPAEEVCKKLEALYDNEATGAGATIEVPSDNERDLCRRPNG